MLRSIQEKGDKKKCSEITNKEGFYYSLYSPTNSNPLLSGREEKDRPTTFEPRKNKSLPVSVTIPSLVQSTVLAFLEKETKPDQQKNTVTSLKGSPIMLLYWALPASPESETTTIGHFFKCKNLHYFITKRAVTVSLPLEFARVEVFHPSPFSRVIAAYPSPDDRSVILFPFIVIRTWTLDEQEENLPFPPRKTRAWTQALPF